MFQESDKINLTDFKKLQGQKIELGAKVQELVKSDGFKLLLALLYNSEKDIKDKVDYKTLEDFRADRKAIEIVRGWMAELDKMIQDGELAADQIQKLIESEDSTPSILSLDGEGIDDGQSAEL